LYLAIPFLCGDSFWMTCVVALKENGMVHMGADSAAVYGWNRYARKDTKVFIKGDFLFGFTESFRLIQVLQYSFEPPKMGRNDNLHAYLCTDFVKEVRKCLEQAGYAAEVKDDKYPVCLLATQGRLFHIMSDLSVGEREGDFDAVGSGSAAALGSLYTSAKWSLSANEKLLLALESAADQDMGVMPPFKILSLQK